MRVMGRDLLGIMVKVMVYVGFLVVLNWYVNYEDFLYKEFFDWEKVMFYYFG